VVADEGVSAVKSVVAVGTFDGVHEGHRHLLGELRRRAAALGASAVVVTCDPPPRNVLHPEAAEPLLTSVDERVALLGAAVDHVEVLPFNREVAGQTAEQFCQGLVDRLGMVELVGGPDLALGRARAGTPEVLREIGGRLGFTVTVLDQVSLGGAPVRSGQIRALLREGNVAEAAKLLGRVPTLSGIVVQGDQRGRTIGVPTANVEPPPSRLVPANGVYAVRAGVGADRHPGVMNVGVRPTVGGVRRVIEVHLLDFDGDLYGQELTVEMVARLRDEQRFPSLDALVAQIRADIARARELLR
jgi:riboflavin kinase/FMN adenylyltransferase